KARKHLHRLQKIWPDLDSPYILNYRPEEEWKELMPDDDETPCLLLDADGRCLVYDYRPMTCRLHGIPLLDSSGEVMHDEWCTLNFDGFDPLTMPELQWKFRHHFEAELSLFRTFTDKLLGKRVSELDTFIPLALLQDFTGFDWRGWWDKGR
ncbi:MAG TPA: YkgJ family cysteine cluster protein, partial [Geomobilimonas sp.]|nr:YkgJ family cysteine cluster protein [Geomobilimonas sp.]